jgi:Bacterial PH domain
MGYIEKTLGGEEALIAKASFHWLYRVFAYGMLVLSLALAGYMYSQASWPGWAAIVAGVGIAVFLRVMVPIWTTEIGVTSDRVIVKRRFLARHTDEIQLSAIEEINVDQGLFGRLLDFGRHIAGHRRRRCGHPCHRQPAALPKVHTASTGDYASHGSI